MNVSLYFQNSLLLCCTKKLECWTNNSVTETIKSYYCLCWITIPVLFDSDLSHHPPCCATFQHLWLNNKCTVLPFSIEILLQYSRNTDASEQYVPSLVESLSPSAVAVRWPEAMLRITDVGMNDAPLGLVAMVTGFGSWLALGGGGAGIIITAAGCWVGCCCDCVCRCLSRSCLCNADCTAVRWAAASVPVTGTIDWTHDQWPLTVITVITAATKCSKK